MTVEQRMSGDVVVLAIDGDITMGDVGRSRLADTVRSVVQEGHHRIALDLGRVRYVDSAGLGELVQCATAVRTRGGVLALLNVTRRLCDLLLVTKLLTAFE